MVYPTPNHTQLTLPLCEFFLEVLCCKPDDIVWLAPEKSALLWLN